MFTFIPMVCYYKTWLSSFLFTFCISSNWGKNNSESGLQWGQEGQEVVFTYSDEADPGGHLVHHVFG